jgi:hypothetical protein
MSAERFMFLVLVVVVLAVIVMACVTILLRMFGRSRSAKKNSSAEKTVEPKK